MKSVSLKQFTAHSLEKRAILISQACHLLIISNRSWTQVVEAKPHVIRKDVGTGGSQHDLIANPTHSSLRKIKIFENFICLAR